MCHNRSVKTITDAGLAALDTLDALAELLSGRRFVALTGAGCSTESGIPDYRGPETQRRARNPIQGREFMGSADVRRRYWARAAVGWERFSRAAPNPAHRALVDLERAGVLRAIITQNVDGLHQAAGSEHVIELHGALGEVLCMLCGALEPRASVQRRLLDQNPGWLRIVADVAPDGDAELPAEHVDRFLVASCLTCGGPLRPRVVFFGENVPRPTVDAAFALVDEASALLVVGSSLAVFSGYRFLLRATQRRIPIAMVNLGPARGKDLCSVAVDAKAGEVLPKLAERLTRARRGQDAPQPA